MANPNEIWLLQFSVWFGRSRLCSLDERLKDKPTIKQEAYFSRLGFEEALRCANEYQNLFGRRYITSATCLTLIGAQRVPDIPNEVGAELKVLFIEDSVKRLREELADPDIQADIAFTRKQIEER